MEWGKSPLLIINLIFFTIMTQDEELKNTLARVVSICTVHLPDGTQTITDKDILGKSRREDILTARCLFVDTLMQKGFTTATLGKYMHRSQCSIRHLQDIARTMRKQSSNYRQLESSLKA